MANTRQSAKRAREEIRRAERNQIIQSATKSAVKAAMDALKSKDVAKAKDTLQKAVRALSKAASKGSFPRRRSERKISRLTQLFQRTLPAVFEKAGN